MPFLIFWSGSFAVQYGDHFRSGIICGPGSFAVLGSFPDPYSALRVMSAKNQKVQETWKWRQEVTRFFSHFFLSRYMGHKQKSDYSLSKHVASVITIHDRYYNLRQAGYYNSRKDVVWRYHTGLMKARHHCRQIKDRNAVTILVAAD